MKRTEALSALAALAQDTRLTVFRLLARQAPAGLPAGAIARRIGAVPSTLSFHLSQLEAAGLVRSRRRQRQVVYAVDAAGIRRLLAFLTEDCCGGQPELCGGVPAATSREEYRPAKVEET